jgi:hypothetical protein
MGVADGKDLSSFSAALTKEEPVGNR